MLNIYYGRENIDKEKFIFDNMEQNALLIVPDQFTLNAEKGIIDYFGSEGLMDIEVVGLSRLGYMILKEEGGGKKTFIDKHGRHIILSKIINKNENELKAFSKFTGKNSFIELLNDFISETKQFNYTLEELKEKVKDEKSSRLLLDKLRDISLIYEEYEKEIEGKYVDSEDYIDLFLPKIRQAKMIKDRDIWIWGFDWISPKTMNIVLEMGSCAKVNIVFTYAKDDRDHQTFEITEAVIGNIEAEARGRGIMHCKKTIDDKDGDYSVLNRKNKALMSLENGLFEVPMGHAADFEKDLARRGAIMASKCANWHSEAENAAAYVLWLLREKGLRLKDIAVICNDLTAEGKLAARVFRECGIDIFIDEKRSIMHHMATQYIVALIEIMTKGYTIQNVLALEKTGFGSLSSDETEMLENYAIEYKIQRGLWKKEFVKGVEKYGASGIEELEALRKKAILPLESFESKFKESKSAESRTEALYNHLVQDAKMPEKLQNTVDELVEQHLNESAQETTQIWNSIVSVLSQIIHILGDEKISLELYRNILMAGLSAVEIGLLPPTVDSLVMGTVQRSRLHNIKALVIIGANEGVLPQGGSGKGLLSEREKRILSEEGKSFGKLDELRIKEERMAIYKCVCAPTEYLYISCSLCDGEGKKQRPSGLWNDIVSYFDLTPVTEISASDNPEKKLFSEGIAYRYLSKAINDMLGGEPIMQEYKEAFWWCREKNPKLSEMLMRGAFCKKGNEKLSREKAEELFSREGSYTVSPTFVERYSKCPFSHFVNYGLRPEELRIFEMGHREIGDLYHECVMEFSKELSGDGKAVTRGDSRWQTIGEKECHALVDNIFDRVSKKYREGVAESDEEEKYKGSRVKKIIEKNCWALVSHVRQGRIAEMRFEEAFGVNKSIPGVEIKGENASIYIEGKIDRVDYLEGGGVKIIDYKSSNQTVSREEIEGGFKLQLMLYLKAALEEDKKPAGIFYFNIKDEVLNAEGLSSMEIKEKVENLVNDYKLKGILVDSGTSVFDIAGDFTGYSKVVSGIRKVKSKENENELVLKGENIMSEEDFQSFTEAFDDMMRRLCNQLLEGSIRVYPKKLKDDSACTYCSYKGICGFDTLIPGCTYDRLKSG